MSFTFIVFVVQVTLKVRLWSLSIRVKSGKVLSKVVITETERLTYVYLCHARVREKLSYLHIPKTKTMCYMYEANHSD